MTGPKPSVQTTPAAVGSGPLKVNELKFLIHRNEKPRRSGVFTCQLLG